MRSAPSIAAPSMAIVSAVAGAPPGQRHHRRCADAAGSGFATPCGRASRSASISSRFGLFPSGDPRRHSRCASSARRGASASSSSCCSPTAMPAFDAVAAAAAIGARGIMLDTADKSLRLAPRPISTSRALPPSSPTPRPMASPWDWPARFAPRTCRRCLRFARTCSASAARFARARATRRSIADACAAIRALIPHARPAPPAAELPEAEAPALC